MQFKSPEHKSLSALLLNWADRPTESSKPPITMLRSLVRLFLITFSEFIKNDLSLRSGALTYTVLLSLVPVLAMSTAVVKGLGGGDQLKSVAYTYIDTLDTSSQSKQYNSNQTEETIHIENQTTELENIEDPAASTLTAHLRDAVDKLFAYVDKTNFATIGTVGVVGIFLSVILVLSNIEMAMNTIWHVEDSRSITRKIFDYLALMVLIPISIIVAFAASAFLKIPTLALKFQMLIPFAWMQTLILKLVPVFFISLTFYAIYIFFPNTKVRTIPALIGSVLAAMLWFGIQNVYITLQVGVSNYNAIYGSLATLPIFLVWMYLGWLFILGGAQVAFACQHLENYRLVHTQSIPSTRLSAAFDIMGFVQETYAEGGKLTQEAIISHHKGYDSSVLQEVLEDLVTAELLYISLPRNIYLPAAPADKISHSDIIRLILGDDIPDTPGGESSRIALHAAAQSGSSEPPEPTKPSPGNLQEGQSST